MKDKCNRLRRWQTFILQHSTTLTSIYCDNFEIYAASIIVLGTSFTFFRRETRIRQVCILRYIMDIHDDGDATMDTKLSNTLPITSSSTGLHTEIKHIQTYELMTYLGYTSQTDGNQKPQLTKHITKRKEFARLISTSNMTRHQIHTSSQNIVNSNLTHILSSTSYTD